MVDSQFFRSECTRKLAMLRPHATFLTVHHYNCINSGKIADWSIVFHISYHNALIRSIEILEDTRIRQSSCLGKVYDLSTLQKAKADLLESYNLSLQGNNYSPSEDSYDKVVDFFGNPIPGVKLHRKQDFLHLYGFVVHSRVILPGRVKHPNHSDLTRAKMDLEHLTPLSRWVQFRLEPERFEKLVVNSITIQDHEIIRQAFPIRKHIRK